MTRGRKLAIGRRGYWIATAVLLTVQWFAPKGLGVAFLAPWVMLYLARLRDADRSALHLLHLAVMFALVLVPVFVAPDAFGAYLAEVPPAQAPTPSTRDTMVFVACMGGCLIYYLAFSIWLGWIKAPPRAHEAEIVEHFT